MVSGKAPLIAALKISAVCNVRFAGEQRIKSGFIPAFKMRSACFSASLRPALLKLRSKSLPVLSGSLGVAKEQNGAHDGILQVLHRKDSLFSSAEMSVSLVEIKFLTGRTSDFLMTDRVKFK